MLAKATILTVKRETTNRAFLDRTETRRRLNAAVSTAVRSGQTVGTFPREGEGGGGTEGGREVEGVRGQDELTN